MASEQLLKMMTAFVVTAFCLPLGGDVYVHGINCYQCFSHGDPSCDSAKPDKTETSCEYCRKVSQNVHFKSAPTVARECIDATRISAWSDDEKKSGCQHIVSEKSITMWVCLCNTDLCNRAAVLVRPLSAILWACALFALLLYFGF